MKRSYSRRELYALGEPLGDSATYRKVGGLVLGDGGGGGGSAPPPDKQTNVTELPEWARPYAKDVLAKGAALTDINQNPYQTYGANRIAGFTPMQQQAFQGAANMQPSQQLGTATDLATAAGIGALGTNYRGGRFSGGTFGQDAADFYMNPYQQNVTDIGKREAARQSNILGTQQAGQATQAGAFGGSRFGVQQAERERNLGQQMADIQAQGSNAAYTNAQQQFNADQARRMQAQQLSEQSRQYGAGLGMQGLQTALQGAGQLGQLGGQQFQQGMDINKLQSAYGGQMQQQAQRPLDQAYQDFLNQQNYPYKQLGFMSDMIRGLPLGQQSTSSIYQAPPSGIQTLGALGMGAYGASKLFGKEGGLMESYAGGGVTRQQNVESILNKLSDQQLQQAKQIALAKRDVEQANMIDAEMAERASIRGGLGGAFNQIPEEQQEQMMAGGGIVAFADRGAVKSDEDEDENDGRSISDLMAASEGNPEAYKKITAMFPQLMANVTNARYTPMTDTAYNDAITKRRATLEAGAGPSPYADYESKLAGMEAEDAKGLEQAKGLAALQAIPAMLQGNNAIRGIGGAGGAFAGAYGQALQADKAQKRSLMNMRINLADAQRKERMGLTRDSIAAADQARKDHDAAQQFGVTKAKALASVAGNYARATKPVGGTGGPKPLKINEQLAEAEVAFENDPSKENKNRVVALRRAVSQTKLTDFGPTRAGLAGEAIEAPTDRDALAALNKFSTSALKKREWQAMIKEHGSEEAARAAFLKNYKVTGGEPAPTKPAPKAGGTAPGGGQKIMTQADVAATAKASKKSEAEVIDAAKKAGYTIQ